MGPRFPSGDGAREAYERDLAHQENDDFENDD